MTKNLFLVHTPFQLMNCLNIIEKHYFNDRNEIVFLHKNMEQYSNLLKKYNENIVTYSYKFLFEENKKKNKLLIRLDLIFKLINGKIQMKDVKNKNQIYNNLFIPSENIGCNVVYNYFYKLNKLIDLFVYDDGVGTYKDGYLKGCGHGIYEKISIVLFGSFFWKNIKGIFSYQPELIDDSGLSIENNKIISNQRVEKIFSENMDKHILNKYDKSNVIYLDQGNLPNSYENTMNFLELCKKYFEKDKVVLKNHPRVKPVYNCNSFKVDNSGNTFESVLFNIDIEDKLLVSMCSTSCLTPFILKDKYPYVIFLGMLNTKRYEDTLNSSYFQNVINNYKPNKIFIPKNYSDLEQVIKFYLEKTQDKFVL